ncbi:MAG: hypothetical protein F6K09_03080 [Merismopedia sp. SIO2A8]|nr:hypothetical protein [Symploca sp. SIO2B6]NET47710.1 hypothetical protein [Merismopedia sp. SIO2A8]
MVALTFVANPAHALDLDIRTGSFPLSSSDPSAVQDGNVSTFKKVEFEPPFEGVSQITVIPMVQTFNGFQTPGIRIAEVNKYGFKIRINELTVKNRDPEARSLSDGTHLTETIGWFAFGS